MPNRENSEISGKAAKSSVMEAGLEPWKPTSATPVISVHKKKWTNGSVRLDAKSSSVGELRKLNTTGKLKCSLSLVRSKCVVSCLILATEENQRMSREAAIVVLSRVSPSGLDSASKKKMESIAIGISKVSEALEGSGKEIRKNSDELPVELDAASVKVKKKGSVKNKPDLQAILRTQAAVCRHLNDASSQKPNNSEISGKQAKSSVMEACLEPEKPTSATPVISVNKKKWTDGSIPLDAVSSSVGELGKFQEYIQDGIDWAKVDFEDYQDCLNLFEKKPLGLLSLLDEESTFPYGTDLTFANKLKQHLNSNSYFRGEWGKAFTVCHYAGEVMYDTTGFLEKNRDLLHLDSIQLLSSCTCHLSQIFASNLLAQSEKPVVGALHKSGGADSQKHSVASKFKDFTVRFSLQVQFSSFSYNAPFNFDPALDMVFFYWTMTHRKIHSVFQLQFFIDSIFCRRCIKLAIKNCFSALASYRGQQARCYLKELRRGVSTLQSLVRGENTRKAFAVLLQRYRSAVVLQKQFKGRIERKRFIDVCRASVLIQSRKLVRTFVGPTAWCYCLVNS
ncbi:hypothetical protein RHMOL_Rhmol12G0063500 [Rhododendron molle]|uniref:Uncharacterized protein n=1 Tax=Rhododendron molle TaxID=49168 RepID=A0ACC0LGL6_RHOML|nr:hypothetical protein RHMOL_Rhmol12G0063500 [Rhododendron molle]